MMYFDPSQMMMGGGWGGGWPSFGGSMGGWGGGFQSPMMGLATSMYQPAQYQQPQGMATMAEPASPNYKPRRARQQRQQGAMVPSMNPAAYRPQTAQSQPGGAPPSFYEAGMFNTPFGQLVQSNSGQGNTYKLNNRGDSPEYYYDPSKGWAQASQQQLQTGGFANPYEYAPQAGANQAQFIQKNGMWQLKPGTGVYA